MEFQMERVDEINKYEPRFSKPVDRYTQLSKGCVAMIRGEKRDTGCKETRNHVRVTSTWIVIENKT